MTLISANNAQLTLAWGSFFENIADLGAAQLSQRQHSLARQLRDNGVTYNVYADEGEPQRPWALDLFPFIIEPASWQQIESGVLQRMRLLECVMADVYGPQQLLERGMLPPALVQGHPGYLRSMHGVSPVGGTRLHVGAFDLGRGPDGNWWLLGQRYQTPSGLGYLLENRLAIAGQFPQAFQEQASAAPDTGPGYFYALNDLLLQCENAASHVSEQISLTYFTHSCENKHRAGHQ